LASTFLYYRVFGGNVRRPFLYYRVFGGNCRRLYWHHGGGCATQRSSRPAGIGEDNAYRKKHYEVEQTPDAATRGRSRRASQAARDTGAVSPGASGETAGGWA